MSISILDCAGVNDHQRKLFTGVGQLLGRNEIRDALGNAFVRTIIASMGAAPVEHAEVLDAQILAIAREIESIDHQELPVLGQADARSRDAGGRGALSADEFIDCKLWKSACIEGLHEVRSAVMRESLERFLLAYQYFRLYTRYAGVGGEAFEQVCKQIRASFVSQDLLQALFRHLLAKLLLLRVTQ